MKNDGRRRKCRKWHCQNNFLALCYGYCACPPEVFKPPFSHASLLYLCFALKMALLGFYVIPLVYLPCDKYSSWSTWRQALWGRERWWGTREDRSTKIFGHVWVQTPATCIAGNLLYPLRYVPQACPSEVECVAPETPRPQDKFG